MEPWEGDPDPSPIGRSLVGTVQGPLRIARPAVREGWLRDGPGSARGKRGAEGYVEVSWDRALDLVAGELERVQSTHGNRAIYGGSYGWASAGRFHHAQSQLHRFLNTIGGYTASTQTYSWAAGEIILPRVLGGTDGLIGGHSTWDTIVEHTELIVAFGGLPLRNTQVQAGGLGRHHVRGRLQDAVGNGVRFVSISPVDDDFPVEFACERLWLRPNTDVAVMLALAHTLIERKLADLDFLETHCVGYEALRDYVTGVSDGTPKTPEWAQAIAGLDAKAIRDLAEAMASSRTMIMTNWAVQRGDHGEQPYWMAIALAAMLGGIGLPGQGFGFGYGASNGGGRPDLGFKWATFPQGTNPLGPPIPVARITDMLLKPGATIDFDGTRVTYPDVRLVYWAGGNPFHHHQDLNRFVDAWQRPETIVVHEHFWNPLARHADVVFPAATFLERDDFSVAARESLVVAMKRVIEPVGEARTDFDIFVELARRMGCDRAFDEGMGPMPWIERIYESSRTAAASAGVALPPFQEFWHAGRAELDRKIRSSTLLRDFRVDPEKNPLRTPSGRIELYSETIASFGYADCIGHPKWYEPLEWLGSPKAARHPLHLLSCQPASKLHSQYDHGTVSLDEKVAGRAPIRISAPDAKERGVRSGDVVRVFNERGACLAGAVVDTTLRRGIVVLATGAWYDPMNPTQIGSLEKHGNPNVLTPDRGGSSLTQAPIPNSALVEIERLVGEPPPLTVFCPPVPVIED